MGGDRRSLRRFLQGGAAAKDRKKRPESRVPEVVRIPIDYSSTITGMTNGFDGPPNNVADWRLRVAEMMQGDVVLRESTPDIIAFRHGMIKSIKPDVTQAFANFLRKRKLTPYDAEVVSGDKVNVPLSWPMHREPRPPTGPDAPPTFARTVDSEIRQRMASTPPDGGQDIFLLYHPGTDWHDDFLSMVASNPLPPNFLGMSANLDAIVIWMRFIRRKFIEPARGTRFHLVIPAYQQTVVIEPVTFPDEVYPLTIHGMAHGSEPYVWLDLGPGAGLSPASLELRHIGDLNKHLMELKPKAAKAAGRKAGAGELWLGGFITAAVTFVCPPAGPPTALIFGARALNAADKARDAVEESFERPHTRVLGRRVLGHHIEDFDFHHHTTPGISTNDIRRGGHTRRRR